jgi:hypothetical protein
MFCPKWRRLKTGHANQSGQTMVEFALVASAFLLLIFGMFDLAFFYYTRVTLQNAVRQGARYAITGNCSNPGSGCFSNINGGGGGSGDRLNSIVNTVVSYSFGLITTSQVSVVCSGACLGYYGNGGTNNAGGPGDTVRIAVTYTWQPWIISKFVPRFGTSFPYTVSSTFRNEQFPPAS